MLVVAEECSQISHREPYYEGFQMLNIVDFDLYK